MGRGKKIKPGKVRDPNSLAAKSEFDAYRSDDEDSESDNDTTPAQTEDASEQNQDQANPNIQTEAQPEPARRLLPELQALINLDPNYEDYLLGGMDQLVFAKAYREIKKRISAISEYTYAQNLNFFIEHYQQGVIEFATLVQLRPLLWQNSSDPQNQTYPEQQITIADLDEIINTYTREKGTFRKIFGTSTQFISELKALRSIASTSGPATTLINQADVELLLRLRDARKAPSRNGVLYQEAASTSLCFFQGSAPITATGSYSKTEVAILTLKQKFSRIKKPVSLDMQALQAQLTNIMLQRPQEFRIQNIAKYTYGENLEFFTRQQVLGLISADTLQTITPLLKQVPQAQLRDLIKQADSTTATRINDISEHTYEENLDFFIKKYQKNAITLDTLIQINQLLLASSKEETSREHVIEKQISVHDINFIIETYQTRKGKFRKCFGTETQFITDLKTLCAVKTRINDEEGNSQQIKVNKADIELLLHLRDARKSASRNGILYQATESTSLSFFQNQGRRQVNPQSKDPSATELAIFTLRQQFNSTRDTRTHSLSSRSSSGTDTSDFSSETDTSGLAVPF